MLAGRCYKSMQQHPSTALLRRRLLRLRTTTVVAAVRHQHQDSMVPVPPKEEEQQQQQGRGGGGGKRKGGTKNPALQHIAWRKYLNHPGVPGGTLFEREQMAAKMRQAETAHKVKQHKVRRFGGQDDQLEDSGEGNKTVRGANSGIMSLVEDKIQLSMIRGEFEALPGKGKPLERERTPGLDRTTDLFMDVLKRNGVLPEWIQRQKRVGAMTDLLRRRLEVELMAHTMEMNPEAEKAHAAQEAAHAAVLSRRPTREAFAARVGGIKSIGEDLAVINSEIDTYNLQVPALHLQKLRVRLDPLVSEAMLSPPSTYGEARQAYRAASREGLLGCTCLMEHRLDHFFEGEEKSGGGTYYVAGGGKDVRVYWSGGRRHKRRDPAGDHIAELLMLPIDALARALSRMFSI